MTAPIRGVAAAAITPRREGPEADFAAMFELIDFLVRAGVRAIALMEATGEYPNFSMEERSRLVALAARRSRVPILAGVGHATLDGALALAREAACAGVAALLLPPPAFLRYEPEDIREFYLAFGREFAGTVPLLLSNVAGETAVELLSTGRFSGIVDSTGDFAGREAVLAGDDALFARMRRAGADGAISSAACAVPELMLALDDAIVARDAGAAARLEARLAEFLEWVERFPAPLAIRKAVLARGLKTGPPASPLSETRERGLAAFAEWFLGWLPDVKRECAGG